MSKVIFPFVNIPEEFCVLLKYNFSQLPSSSSVMQILSANKAMYRVLENCFLEFSDNKGLEKAFKALGWANFRERMASIFMHKMIYGDYPSKTKMDLVADLIDFENTYRDHSVTSFSRLFLLGYYIKAANMEFQSREGHFHEIKFHEDLRSLLQLSVVRAERIDWLMLILFHFNLFLGFDILVKCLERGESFKEIYAHVLPSDRRLITNNFLAYGASIREPDYFLFEKV